MATILHLSKLARKTATWPLETIALSLLFVSLCYFILVHLLPAPSSLATLHAKPLRLLIKGHEIVASDPVESLDYLLSDSYFHKFSKQKNLYVRQFVISSPGSKETIAKSTLQSIFDIHNYIEKLSVSDQNGLPYTYSDLCYKQNGTCVVISPLQAWNYSLKSFEEDPDYLGTLKTFQMSETNYLIKHLSSSKASQNGSFDQSLFITYILDIDSKSKSKLLLDWDEKLATLRTEKLYSTYPPFYSLGIGGKSSFLAQVGWKVREFSETSTPSDMILFAISIISMHITFISHFINMRKLGSRFTLGFAVLLNGSFSFIIAQLLARAFGFSLNLIQLCESLPLLVVAIGFEKPVTLTRAVMAAEGVTIQEKVEQGIRDIGPSLIFNYIIEISILILAGQTGIPGGLKEFCFTAAAILIFDAIFLFTSFISVLTLKLELQKMKDSNNQNHSSPIPSSNLNSGIMKIPIPALSNAIDPIDLCTVNVAVPYILRSLKPDDSEIETLLSSPILKGITMMTGDIPSQNFVFWMYLLILLPLVLLARYIGTILPQKVKIISSQDPELSPTSSMSVSKPLSQKISLTTSEPAQIPPKVLPVISNYCLEADEALLDYVLMGKIPAYSLEKTLGDYTRAVKIRRMWLSKVLGKEISEQGIPFNHYNYEQVFGKCCENVIGYLPIPIGIAGPLIIDGVSYQIPMATTEGCLVASTSRGCKALNAGNGVTTVLLKDGMSRGPVVQFPSIVQAFECKQWVESDEGNQEVVATFNSTSNYAKLKNIKIALCGKLLYLRFVTFTGDAMGMNMISKGTEKALLLLSERFSSLEVISVSGNYCTDKKPAAINWIEGRGKSVSAEAVVPGNIVSSVLKTSVESLVNLNISKNLIGSAMAGSIGGFNAHAANILTAIYLATGQDPAQNVESSNCITIMESINQGKDLYISVTMPCIEVGTLGGGTGLSAQKSCLELLGVSGSHPEIPGKNAQTLSRIICAAVIAGELSLCSALAAGELVKSHMVHNRGKVAETCIKS